MVDNQSKKVFIPSLLNFATLCLFCIDWFMSRLEFNQQLFHPSEAFALQTRNT